MEVVDSEGSDLEDSSRLGEIEAKIARGEKKRKASSPAVKEVDRTEQIRILREEYRGMMREVEEVRRAIDRLQDRLKSIEEEIRDAERFFGDSGEGFQVVGKGRGQLIRGVVRRRQVVQKGRRLGRSCIGKQMTMGT